MDNVNTSWVGGKGTWCMYLLGTSWRTSCSLLPRAGDISGAESPADACAFSVGRDRDIPSDPARLRRGPRDGVDSPESLPRRLLLLLCALVKGHAYVQVETVPGPPTPPILPPRPVPHTPTGVQRAVL